MAVALTFATLPGEAASSRPKKVVTLNAWRDQSPYALAISSDGKTLVAAGENFSLQVWDLPHGKFRYESLNESDDPEFGPGRRETVWGMHKLIAACRSAGRSGAASPLAKQSWKG